jgi:bifunctional UDP-N-acetylglucosamine pyrophosphorylase/glucosamine-1-phosphate N-acetyltransferase
VTIEQGCILRDAVVGDGAKIRAYSVVTDARVGSAADVGPFVHLRPGTRVDDGAHIGNFVEALKTHVMQGANVGQLSYVGHATVGAESNLGAGTITCDYDGKGYAKTTIERGAFVGSNSQLVAPVTVGRDAYVGAGTTVTRDVSRGSLALSRAKQVNVEGWADRFREARQKRAGNPAEEE